MTSLMRQKANSALWCEVPAGQSSGSKKLLWSVVGRRRSYRSGPPMDLLRLLFF